MSEINQDNFRTSPSPCPFASRLQFTLKAWPVIAIATIGLCFLTQLVAKAFGVELPDQQNVDVVRKWLTCAFDSTRNYFLAVMLVGQIVLLMPVLEECVFRWLLVMLPKRVFDKRRATTDGRFGEDWLFWGLAVVSSALFSAAHYIAQPWPDAAFVALFFFGLAQCWLYAKTKRIWCAMLNHALFNVTNLVLLFVVPQS